MKKALVASLLIHAVAAGLAHGGDKAAWWNAEYHFRVPVTVGSLFQERQDALVRAKVDFAELLTRAAPGEKLDGNSVRVVEVSKDGKSAPVACRFISANGVSGHVCWIMAGKTATLAERTYMIYFDIAENGPKPKPEAADVPGADTMAGVNLVKNPGFEEPDPKDPNKAADWTFGKATADEACRTDEEARSGKYSLKIVTTEKQLVRSVYQYVPVEAGKKYLVRGWVKCPNYQKGAAGVWAWYVFDKPRHKEYGNYKTSAAGRVTGEWTQRSASWINIQIKKTKEQRKIPVLMPGTVKASISPSAYYGVMTLYLDDIEFIELGEKKSESVEVKLGEPEALKR